MDVLYRVHIQTAGRSGVEHSGGHSAIGELAVPRSVVEKAKASGTCSGENGEEEGVEHLSFEQRDRFEAQRRRIFPDGGKNLSPRRVHIFSVTM